LIEKLKTITKFGVFQDFDWDSTLRDQGNNIATFKKLNIVYGRNYSGKTTLSRIVRSLEQGRLPSKFSYGIFDVACGGRSITQNSLGDHEFDIRVYNEDFVNDNLTFLINDNEDIQSFTVLGEANVEIERKINNLETELGNEDEKKGLKYELLLKNKEKEAKRCEKNNLESSLDDKLRKKANNEIKSNRIYNDVNYNISKIKQDIRKIKKSDVFTPLSEDEIESNKKLLNEKAKDDVKGIQDFTPSISTLAQESIELISREITPTNSIQDLLNNALLQEWVRNGIKYHKDKRDDCAFCGNRIPSDLWNKLDSHFSKESELLRDELKEAIEKLEGEKLDIDVLLPFSISELYSIYHDNFRSVENLLKNEVKKYNQSIDGLIKKLEKRLKDIFAPIVVDDYVIDTESIANAISNLSDIIENHNNKTTTLNNDQYEARVALRVDEVGRFLVNIDYDNIKTKISKLEVEQSNIQDKVNELSEKIEQLESRIKTLKDEQRDERKGAEKINEYLHHFFGNGNIRFEAVEDIDGSGYKFRVLRDDQIAHSLSEGERSLVAFCYFMAKLEDIETKGKKLIIWIDDPISSLDGNHIFFIFSLIESIIAKPRKTEDGQNEYKYDQLIISTHNLDFLKYLKRLSHPRNNNGGTEYFLIDRSDNSSKILLMPSYLKRYVTEFNFLFHQIYKCSKINSENVEHEVFYNFGNNLRKFLEAYLFYRYPCHVEDKLEKLRLFFGDDNKAVEVSNRMSNELSHLEEIFDRSIRPIEIPEIPKIAQYVLDKIKEKDEDQYVSLLKSIGESNEE